PYTTLCRSRSTGLPRKRKKLPAACPRAFPDGGFPARTPLQRQRTARKLVRGPKPKQRLRHWRRPKIRRAQQQPDRQFSMLSAENKAVHPEKRALRKAQRANDSRHSGAGSPRHSEPKSAPRNEARIPPSRQSIAADRSGA